MAGGAWVHVFPEGHVGYSGRLEPCRWGVGRLVCDAAVAAGRCRDEPDCGVVRQQWLCRVEHLRIECQLPRHLLQEADAFIVDT